MSARGWYSFGPAEPAEQAREKTMRLFFEMCKLLLAAALETCTAHNKHRLRAKRRHTDRPLASIARLGQLPALLR
jgi:hypothetical protein